MIDEERAKAVAAKPSVAISDSAAPALRAGDPSKSVATASIPADKRAVEKADSQNKSTFSPAQALADKLSAASAAKAAPVEAAKVGDLVVALVGR
jgi:F420-0:gamma-glutamyl ligase